MLAAMGMGVVLVEDADAVRRMGRRWNPKDGRHARDNGRIGKSLIKRVKPIVMTDLAKKGAAARWAGMSPDERRSHIELMNLGRQIKALAGKTEAA